ncbi:hypothetical protein NliqN6_4895 [Naganishia liquefaciens]|uniref:Condensin complex subunit 2 n=1 Tax=Naganishia liquefaciens TaxID=104408 RepID=A0A8H3YGP0_9TREE|nr:hypothetical protein NliqN6_4895 [Naganishia liquefaciens]
MPAARSKTKHTVAPGTPTSDASSRRSLSIRRRKDGRAPLSDLPVNDDESERDSRRKSGSANTFAERSKRRTSGLRKQVEDNDDSADARDANGVSHGPTKASEKKRKTTVGSALDRSTGGTESRNNSARTKKPRLSVVSRPQGQNSMIVPVGAGDKASAPQVSMEIMSSNFEEWMKMATDNKITANNTWSFALIDYFADLTLLRNGPNDTSINFQKASCTLDGCVKVWTSRVDSVATETGKLLSGLADDIAGGDGDGVEANEEGDEEEDGEEGAKKTKKRAQGNQATLAKSFDALKVKKFDLEFTVDPLFKKTSADFDEGGAMGLLMNHLSIDGKGRVVFDSGDVEVDEDDEDDDENQKTEAIEDEIVDLEKLQESLPAFDDVAQRSISTTLADFKFTSDPNEAFSLAALTGMSRDDDNDSIGAPVPAFAGGEEEDFFGGGNDMNDHDQGGGDYEGFFGAHALEDVDEDGQGNTSGLQNSGNTNNRVVYGPTIPFDPSKSTGPNGLVMAKDDGEAMMLDYFDQGFLKNWAGPEHWKLRRAVRRVEPTEDAGVAKLARKEKTPFLIDFENAESPSAKDLFAPSKTAITLPGSGGKRARAATPPKGKKGRKPKAPKEEPEVRDEHLLPDDMHFSSRQLLRLFMKPKFTLKMRRRIEMSEITQDDGEVDENFWANAAAARGQGDMDNDIGDSQPNGYDGQFFHDDVDDAADFAEVDDGLLGEAPVEGDEDDLWAGAQGLKKAKPETVNYAKRAKRVDVKRLKDNIWKGLKIPARPSKDEADTQIIEEPDYTPGDERTFSSVIENLRDSYSSDKMSEISTSFCFICLLHLANEQGLEIEPARFDDGTTAVGVIGEAEGIEASGGKGFGASIDTRNDCVVGELQALKIRKDMDMVEVA